MENTFLKQSKTEKQDFTLILKFTQDKESWCFKYTSLIMVRFMYWGTNSWQLQELCKSNYYLCLQTL